MSHYRVIALISVNIVLSWDIERRELASSNNPIYFVPIPVVCGLKS